MCMIAVLFIKIEYLNIFLKTSYISDMDYYVIQGKKDSGDDLGMISIFLHKNIFCDPSLEPSGRNGSVEGHNICSC